MQQEHIHLHIHLDSDVITLFNHFAHHLLYQGERIMALLDSLQAAVAAESTVIDSAVALLQGLKAQLDAAIAAGSNPAQLQAISDAIAADTSKLANAVAANTPATP